MAKLLDGKLIRDQILDELRPRIAALPRSPGLAVVLVGADPASELYVGSKVRTCHELGIYSENIRPDANISTEQLLIRCSNGDLSPRSRRQRSWSRALAANAPV